MASELIVQTLKGPTSGANANKVIIPSGQTLDIDAWTPPAGTVLQIVQGEYAAEQDTTSTSFVSTGLTATITPSSTSSKIYIQVALACSGAYEAAGGGAAAIYRIYDVTNSSALIQTADRYNDYGNSGGFSFSNHAINYLHSPSTTSAITYRVDHKLSDGDASRVFNDQGGGSKGTITLMEIAG